MPRNEAIKIAVIEEQIKGFDKRFDKLEEKQAANHNEIMGEIKSMNKWMNLQKGAYAGIGTFIGGILSWVFK